MTCKWRNHKWKQVDTEWRFVPIAYTTAYVQKGHVPYSIYECELCDAKTSQEAAACDDPIMSMAPPYKTEQIPMKDEGGGILSRQLDDFEFPTDQPKYNLWNIPSDAWSALPDFGLTADEVADVKFTDKDIADIAQYLAGHKSVRI